MLASFWKGVPNWRARMRIPAMAALVLVAGAVGQTCPAPAYAAPCGSYVPGSGQLTAEFIPSGGTHTFNEFVGTTTFKFSQAEIKSLRCSGSSTLEVDVLAEGGLAGGGIKSGWSNMPDSYLDTEY